MDANDILKDETENDQLLIKELSVCIKNHKNKKLPVNSKLVKDLVNIVLKNSELDYDYVIFTDQINDIACWMPEDKAIVFNITGILNYARYSKKELLM